MTPLPQMRYPMPPPPRRWSRSDVWLAIFGGVSSVVAGCAIVAAVVIGGR